ncbi:hypothetical protein R3P38DRAFT_975096 [Favolaschia claudopus]|uniref:Uncharacterized protein n=1 Tax=Favolaschia claudopus TaxID=2862362 RepID=A0AAW0E703_9AGAR
MKFTFALLAAFIASAVGAPAGFKRQDTCPLQNFSGLTVTASADGKGKTRWNVFVAPRGLVQSGDLGWFVSGQPGKNEKFNAVQVQGSQPNLFTFKANGGSQNVAVVGSKLLASAAATPATFQVRCFGCNSFAKGNDLVANGCAIELTDGTNGTGQCVSFEGQFTGVQLQQCDGNNSGQFFGLFNVA